MSAQLETSDVTIIGAGLAGLACARVVHDAGYSFQILEAADGVGGRVRTDIVDGFRLDRGFQIALSAYPELQRQLDLPALEMRPFAPGALVWANGRGHVVADPWREPRSIVSTLTSRIGSLQDKVRIGLLRRRVLKGPAADLLRGVDISTVASLRTAGFSDTFVESFFRPLVGGIQLDPALSDSRRMFDIILRSLSEGDAVVPANGMGAIPDQMASRLPPNSIKLNTRVSSVSGSAIHTTTGQVLTSRVVVVATEGPTAAALLGLPAVGSKPATAVWFAADTAPVQGRHIVLDGTGTGPVLNVAVTSEVAPSYAPPGQALIVCSLPGLFLPDAQSAARSQLRGWWGPSVDRWRHLRTDTIAHGQPTQEPPFSPKQCVSLGEGLFICGDHRDTGSIQGALYSGRRAGLAVCESMT